MARRFLSSSLGRLTTTLWTETASSMWSGSIAAGVNSDVVVADVSVDESSFFFFSSNWSVCRAKGRLAIVSISISLRARSLLALLTALICEVCAGIPSEKVGLTSNEMVLIPPRPGPRPENPLPDRLAIKRALSCVNPTCPCLPLTVEVGSNSLGNLCGLRINIDARSKEGKLFSPKLNGNGSQC